MIKLNIYIGGSKEPYELQLKPGMFTVGRDDDNNIVLEDESISGRHSKFTYEHGRWYVEDLDSTNGVRIGDHKIVGRYELRDGDFLTLGQLNIQVNLNAPMPLAAAPTAQPVLFGEFSAVLFKAATIAVIAATIVLMLNQRHKDNDRYVQPVAEQATSATVTIQASTPDIERSDALTDLDIVLTMPANAPVPVTTDVPRIENNAPPLVVVVEDKEPAEAVAAAVRQKPAAPPAKMALPAPNRSIAPQRPRAARPAVTSTRPAPARKVGLVGMFEHEWSQAVNARKGHDWDGLTTLTAKEQAAVQQLAYRAGLAEVRLMEQRAAAQLNVENTRACWLPVTMGKYEDVPIYIERWMPTGTLLDRATVQIGEKTHEIEFVHETRGFDFDREFRLTVKVDGKAVMQKAFSASKYDRGPRPSALLRDTDIPDFMVQTPDNTLFLAYAEALDGINIGEFKIRAKAKRFPLPVGHISQIPRDAWNIHELKIDLIRPVKASDRRQAMRSAIQKTLSRFDRT